MSIRKPSWTTGRATKGVRLIGLHEGDSVAAIARIAAADLRLVGASEEETDNQEKVSPSESTAPPTDK